MKPNLLLIGGATPRMMDQLSDHFVIHEFAEIDDLEAFANEKGSAIEAIATNGHDGVKPEIMTALTNLKVISCFGVGYDAIDARSAAERGIMVTHTPTVLNNDVANTAIMLMLAVSRCLVRDDDWVRSGKWKSRGDAPLTRSIEKKPVGILGMGRIGRRIAEKLQAFDCDVSYHSRRKKSDVPYRYYADLTEMTHDVDYLVVVTPGGADTLHLVNRQVIDALGPEGTLINVARGSVVDEPELVRALGKRA
jgi:lactate dehydrogenase-like 2-hydroxyacid dehydrogenase